MDINEKKPVDLANPEERKIDSAVMDVILKEKHDAMMTIDKELDKVKNDLQILAAITNAVDVETATLAQVLITKGVVTTDELKKTYQAYVEQLKEQAKKAQEDMQKAETTPEAPTAG